MATTFQFSTFLNRINDVFSLSGSATPVNLELVECTPLTVHSSGQTPVRESFSLVFRAPKDVVLPQRIYSLHNEEMGTLEIFLVPIGPDSKGLRYEAVFN